MALVACLEVPYFTAAAVERCEPALVERPLAVVRGAPPATRVVEANAAAREYRVTPGLTEAAARARCPALVTRPESEALVASARHALLEAMLAISPRLEDTAPGLVHVDVEGLGRLIGPPAAVGARMLGQARAVGLTARVGVAAGRTAALVAARRAGPGRVVAVAPRDTAALLAAAPLVTLDLPAGLARTLAGWGLRTLGDLAALPAGGLAERLGPAGLAARELARGRDPRPFRPWTPPPFWVEAQALDWEVHDLPALTAVLRVVLDRLAARLAAAHVAADSLDLGLGLADGARHERTLALAHPTRDAGALLALARLDLEAHPPAAPVTAVTASARTVVARAGQRGLWQPPVPLERDLAALLTRLTELVGPGNLGSPVLDDAHRPDAFTLQPFRIVERDPSPPAGATRPGPDPPPPIAGAPPAARLVLRRLRPPHPVEVTADGERPARVTWGGVPARVLRAAGPWRMSGEWWDTRGWARDEWDVLLAGGLLCRLALDHRAGHWLLEGIYD